MFRGLFQHRNNVLVEGMTDYYYLLALSRHCGRTSRTSLRDDIYIVPCGGTKYVGNMASLFLAEDVRPVILLDSDDAGKVRRDSLLTDLYTNFASKILMLADILGTDGTDVDIEDIIGETIFLDGINDALGLQFRFNDKDSVGSLPGRVKEAARREGIALPEGWKFSVALHLVSRWDREGMVPDEILEAASQIFQAINDAFEIPIKP